MKQIKIIAAFAFAISAFQMQAQVTPTWADNVACILYTRCTSCHNPNGAAPFSLMTYTDAFNFAEDIDSSVQAKRMPPWPPNHSYQTYAHERVLTQDEIDIIDQWVAAGSPQGNAANAPTPPVYSGISQMPNPDLNTKMPTYQIPPITSDLYRCFVIPNVTSIDKFISGMEVLPGNRNIVHHVLVFQDQGNTVINLDNADTLPGYTSFGGIGSNTAELIGLWAPGAQPYFLPQAMGIKLKANSHIILQIHYPLGTSGQYDSTQVNFKYSTTPFTRQVNIDPILNHDDLNEGFLYIPADSVRTFTCDYTVPIDVTVLSVAPHMHLVGTEISARGVTPLNDTLKLIDIPKWDFHWQGAYDFRQPVKVPSGTTLHSRAFYDNTANNLNNPNTPPKAVYLGENTTNEMMLIYFFYTYYLPGDENIVVDTNMTVQSYNGCNFSLGGTEAWMQQQYSVAPNPATNSITVIPGWQQNYEVRIQDMLGKTVKTISAMSGATNVDINDLAPGMYNAQLFANNKLYNTKFVKQ